MSESLVFYGARRRFAQHYIPMFMAGMFCAGASLGCALIIILSTYLRGVSLERVGSPIAITCFLLMILVVLSNYLIARGRPCWMWVMIAFSILCFFIVLPSIAFHPHRLIYTLGICFPLLCLFILNTTRHREFRQKCLAFRRRREADERELKAQRLLENKRAAFRERRQALRVRKALSRKSR